MNINTTTTYDMIPSVDGKLPVAGSHVFWAGYDWTVVDVDNCTPGVMYLILSDIYSMTEFGDTSLYAKSKLASAVADFQRTLPDTALSMLVDVTVLDVTSKVFIPTIMMINHGFQWFNTYASRIATYNGVAADWWVSPSYSASHACYISSTGNRYVSVSGPHGVRPCVAMRIHPTAINITEYNFDMLRDGNVPEVGSVIPFAGYNWRVVDVDNCSKGVMYLILDNIRSMIEFGHTSVYANSMIAFAAADFQRALPNEALSMLANVTVEKLTSKVFVPCLEMINNGFQWFKDGINRLATYNGKDVAWWTSSSVTGSCYACYVYTDGIAHGDGYIGSALGFRPCIAVKLYTPIPYLTNPEREIVF